ncbi:MAG: hypothetical protein NTU80_07235 [Verrucomicrobia bacterium]|nr:hypothetical protein [Verrucomicrobiota bacterium]
MPSIKSPPPHLSSGSVQLPLGPSHKLALSLVELLGDAAIAAAAMAARATYDATFRRKRGPRRKVRPGLDTPLWNALAPELRRALLPYGAKARLARHLGIPRQRLQDYLKAGARVPDGEITLRLLHWLGEMRAGRDPSGIVPPDPDIFPPGKV